MGPSSLYKLGMMEIDLLELDLKTANRSGIDIIGAVFIEIGGMGSSGKMVKTKQLVLCC